MWRGNKTEINQGRRVTERAFIQKKNSRHLQSDTSAVSRVNANRNADTKREIEAVVRDGPEACTIDAVIFGS